MSLPSGLPEHVGDAEPLARFLTSSGHYNAEAPKPAAFLPNPKNGETSVFRQLEELALLDAGRKYVGMERPLHGAAIVSAKDVREAELEAVAKEPPPRHADIVGWPWAKDDPALGKAQQKEMAIKLAQKAKLVRFS